MRDMLRIIKRHAVPFEPSFVVDRLFIIFLVVVFVFLFYTAGNVAIYLLGSVKQFII